MFREEGEVDWALGEAFAFGSLLLEGTDIRLAGQDSRRGTFSHRHAVLVDNETEADWAPLANLDPDQAKFWIYDSLLSRVRRARLRVRLLRRQQGRRSCCGRRSSATSSTAPRSSSTSTSSPPRTSGASANGLVMLLPHGYEGQGPEHSSARIERFLSACAEDNIQVANATTAGAVLPPAAPPDAPRRCASRWSIFTPKSLLRAKSARSKVEELTDGLVPRGARRPDARRRRRRGARGSCWRRARSATTPSPRATSRGAGRAGAAGRAALPVALRLPGRGARRATRTPASSCGSRRSPRTWAPGTS